MATDIKDVSIAALMPDTGSVTTPVVPVAADAPVTTSPTRRPKVTISGKGGEPLTMEAFLDNFDYDTKIDDELDNPIWPTAKQVDAPEAVDTEKEAVDTKAVDSSTSTPKHPAYLTNMARRLGVKDSLIERLDSETLGEMIADLNERGVAPAAPAKPTAPEPEVEEDLGLGDLEADLDPRIVALLKKQAKTISSLGKHVQSKEQAEAQRQNEAVSAAVDRVFNELSDAMGGIFGKGTAKTLDRNSDEYLRRATVIEAAKALTARNPDITPEEAISKATQRIYPTKPKAAAAKPANGKPAANGRITEDAWDAATLARPSQRANEEPKGERKAARTAARKLAELTSDLETGDEDVLAGFHD